MSSAGDRIWDIGRGFQPSRVLLSAVELGVFGALGDDAKASADVAKVINADARATDRLMDALVVMGLLVKENGLFRNSADTAEVLVPGKPGYIGGGLMHTVNLWKTWSTLTDAVRAGHSVYQRPAETSEDSTRAFIAAMHVISTSQAKEIVSLIDLTGVNRMLDVGGGSGGYSIGFCQAKPDLQSVVFDMPDVVPLTQEYARQAGMEGRISTVTGDFNTDPLPTGFDLVFMSQILHSNSRAECAELIKKGFNSLNPGGRLVIQDFIPNEDRTAPPGPVFFALNMLVGTPEGDTFTESEIRGWLEEAGFADIKRIDPPTANSTLIIGKKH